MNILIQKEENGMYFVQLPNIPGVWAEGKTLEEALEELVDVYTMIMEERNNYQEKSLAMPFFSTLLSPSYRQHLLGLNFNSLQLAV